MRSPFYIHLYLLATLESALDVKWDYQDLVSFPKFIIPKVTPFTQWQSLTSPHAPGAMSVHVRFSLIAPYCESIEGHMALLL